MRRPLLPLLALALAAFAGGTRLIDNHLLE